MNDFTLSTVIHVNLEGDGQVSVRNGASVVLKFSLFDRNVQNKHKTASATMLLVLFNLKTNNSEDIIVSLHNPQPSFMCY